MLETFENARFHLKSDDEAYKIFHVTGELFYMNSDFAACLEKKNEITEELTKKLVGGINYVSDDTKRNCSGT